MKEEKRHTSDFAITRKLRTQDVLLTDEGYLKIGTLIKERPMFLWNIVHKRNRGVTLTIDTYALLKDAVRKIEPQKVIAAEKFAINYKTRCKLARGEGNFKLLGKRLKLK